MKTTIFPIALLVLMASCSSRTESTISPVDSDQTISVIEQEYHGWDAFVFSNSLVKAVVVPGIARIMDFRLVGGDNVIWQNESMWGMESIVTNSDWQNFGGVRLSVSPQAAWGWPPAPLLDRGSCKSSVDAVGLNLQGQPVPALGVRLDRSLSMEKDSQVFHLSYSMQNISTNPVSWGIWNIVQLRPGGRVMLPAPKDAVIWEATEKEGTGIWKPIKDGKLKFWARVDDLLVMQHTNQTSKIFATSSQGWVAYIYGDTVYVLSFEADVNAEYPAGEGSAEVYTNGGYVELEHIGPLVTLLPGEKTVLIEKWHLFKLDKIYSDKELQDYIAKVVVNSDS